MVVVCEKLARMKEERRIRRPDDRQRELGDLDADEDFGDDDDEPTGGVHGRRRRRGGR
jgi:hypothetical protein